ncbi:LPXTG cell wall anchor domain-containing protein [Glycomyces sp. TRM65418]|uniref:LPXTG cell wall anchor domain-containing protein n=1 Tax=Glycomyces sp. TRM65418 TaxID=2867006 RepID=UPI001CE4C5C5|nr:LPXTG cell wall anchor domain-containing protein [Glycomyces sp. TRM65418]MCC3764643.1 LPXTG cell wall anchor domain-containing protein [Glycomyces sp. TRM65418]QZD54305.1 LPXTG cell wall anchor domain-containing protein [Glycomyces sp. TRM65418]
MSTLNKTGLRLAAAGAAAALTLAAGAPAFAQETPAADDTNTTPAADETTTPAADETSADDATTAPADDATSEAGDDTAGDDADNEVIDDIESEVEQNAEDEEEDYYEFLYLDQILQGADAGSTVSADVQVQVTGTPAEDRASTLFFFTDAVDFDKWTDPDNAYTDEELTDESAKSIDAWDNCAKDGIWLVCIVDDWSPEEGKTYAPTAPVQYLIENEVSEFGMSVYAGWDLDQHLTELYATELGLDLENGNQFSLAELDESEIGPEEDFAYVEGWIFFEASLGQLPNVPTAEEPVEALPSTGNSQTIMISSAAAALLAGAVVFYLLRRRKAAATWE